MRSRAAWVGVCLLATVQAMAAPLGEEQLTVLRNGARGPHEAAAALARTIGREADVEGFRTLVELHSVYLLWQAQQSFDVVSQRVVDERLEALIADHYADPELHRPLLALLARDADQGGRFPKYRSRRLFDLLYGDMMTGGPDRLFHAIRLVATDVPGIEPLLAKALPALDAASANELVVLLGRRRHAAAVPALRELQARIAHTQDVNGLLGNIDQALLRIGTADAYEAVLKRLASLGHMPDPQAGYEVSHILTGLSELPDGAGPGYAAIRAALPRQLNASAQGALARLIARRREMAAVPDLIPLLASTDAALDALLSLGSAQDWEAARVELDRLAAAGQLSRERDKAVRTRLDAALADPVRFAAQQRQWERSEAMQQARAVLNKEQANSRDLQRSDPRAYVEARRSGLARLEQLVRANADLPVAGMRDELGKGYVELGHFVRFKMRDPQQAIAFYEKASAASTELPLHQIAIADTLRFDLGRPREALAQYRGFEQSLQRARVADQEQPMKEAIAAWLRHEIAYLETGHRFAGPLKREDAVGAQLFWLVLAALSSNVMPESIRVGEPVRSDALSDLSAWMASAPASQFHLAAGPSALGRLPDAEMQRFFDRHDPAGYLSAALLGGLVFANAEATPARASAAPVSTQAQRMLQQRGIALEFGGVRKTDGMPQRP